MRTHTCGNLRRSDCGKNVKLCGWVAAVRNKGALIWVDLRDRHGITQILFEGHKMAPSLMERAKKLGREDVIQVEGEVQERGAKNPNHPTGSIEIFAKELKRLNPSKTPPFLLENTTDGGEELRMRHRYLDLRRPIMQENMVLRHRVKKFIRDFLNHENFLELETPFLVKSTPEGARDFLVPSRMHKGEYYALPQSPQLFKQLFMVAGLDRYYQIVRCFRDEDFRADRQPEFTQIDLELSFVEEKDVENLVEKMIRELFWAIKGIKLPDPFPKMTYKAAMEEYGSDKPDLRWDMPLVKMRSVREKKEVPPFDEDTEINGWVLKGGASYSRKERDAITQFLQSRYGESHRPCYIAYKESGPHASLDKWYSQRDYERWKKHSDTQKGDLLILLGGSGEEVFKAMGDLRLYLIEKAHDRFPKKRAYAPLWVSDFPLFEWSKEEKRYHAKHHPFTAPNRDDLAQFGFDPKHLRARAYDLVINGHEVGGGSIRIHDQKAQEELFKALELSDYKKQFGFLLEALAHGAPPHGGFAGGLDRICMLLGGGSGIRDYIAFTKNNKGRDPLLDAPTTIENREL